MVAESTNLTPEDKEITKKIVEVFPNETMYIAEASLNNSVLRNDFLKNYEEMTEEIHRKSGELLALFQQRKENETAQKITLDDIQKQTTEMYDVDLLVEKIFQKNIPDLLAIIEKGAEDIKTTPIEMLMMFRGISIFGYTRIPRGFTKEGIEDNLKALDGLEEQLKKIGRTKEIFFGKLQQALRDKDATSENK